MDAHQVFGTWLTRNPPRDTFYSYGCVTNFVRVDTKTPKVLIDFNNRLYFNFLQNKHEAQRALLRNGEQLSATCMVGVKRMERSKQLAIDRQSGNAGFPETLPKAMPKASSTRPYQIHAAASAVTFVPLSSKSTWDKVMEFIIGLR